jgi:hypothetical protein
MGLFTKIVTNNPAQSVSNLSIQPAVATLAEKKEPFHAKYAKITTAQRYYSDL